jgi:recombination protein RecA
MTANRIIRVRPGGAVPKEKSELEAVLKQMRKQYGPHIASLANEMGQPERIPTGIFILDFALLGGIPHNRITHIVGERSAGKSLLASKIAAGAQQQFPDNQVVLIDVEGTQETTWTSKLGVDPEKLLVVQPETGEHAVDIVDALASSREVSLLIVDSIAALVPMRELDVSAEDALVGEQARLVGRMIRKVTAILIKERARGHAITILLVNQFRSRIGGYGDPRTLPGGRAIEFCATLQLIMKNKETQGRDEYDVEAITENEHSFLIQKNKINGGVRTGEFRLMRLPNVELGLSEGDVDDAGTLFAYAKKFGVYTGGGSSWTLDFGEGAHRFRGVTDASIALYQNPELYWQLRNHLIARQAEHLGMSIDFIKRFA